MKIVKIRREAEPFNGAFNILLDVGGGVGDFLGPNLDTALRGD
jgi:hypothetical protein